MAGSLPSSLGHHRPLLLDYQETTLLCRLVGRHAEGTPGGSACRSCVEGLWGCARGPRTMLRDHWGTACSGLQTTTRCSCMCATPRDWAEAQTQAARTTAMSRQHPLLANPKTELAAKEKCFKSEFGVEPRSRDNWHDPKCQLSQRCSVLLRKMIKTTKGADFLPRAHSLFCNRRIHQCWQWKPRTQLKTEFLWDWFWQFIFKITH